MTTEGGAGTLEERAAAAAKRTAQAQRMMQFLRVGGMALDPTELLGKLGALMTVVTRGGLATREELDVLALEAQAEALENVVRAVGTGVGQATPGPNGKRPT
jgi:hypothetical protein